MTSLDNLHQYIHHCHFHLLKAFYFSALPFTTHSHL